MASDDRTNNVKLLLRQAVGLPLYTKPFKVQEKLKLYEEIRASNAIGLTIQYSRRIIVSKNKIVENHGFYF